MRAKKLREDIRRFQKRKKYIAIPLIVIGAILSLPLVPGPGLAIVFLGILLLFPREGHKMLNWMKERWRRFRGKTQPEDSQP